MATPSLPPVPSPGGDTTTAPPLVRPPQEQAAQPNDSQERARAIMNEIRRITSSIDGLAAQFPSGAKHARKANDAMKDLMLSIVQEVQKQPGSNPAPEAG